MSIDIDNIIQNITEIEKNIENIKFSLNLHTKTEKRKKNITNKYKITKKNRWSEFTGHCLKKGIPMNQIRKYYDKNTDIDKLIASLP